jgi:hypothetical protein
MAPPPAAARRRLARLRDHVRGGPPPRVLGMERVAAGAAESEQPTAAGAAPPKLLSTRQVKDFIVNGFLELQVPELPPGFNESFYEEAKQLRDESRDTLWAALTPGVNTLLASPTCHGAMQSLLGTDYFMAPGNSHMHVANAGDQGFHKDGTDHGPTQGTVRDHRARHLLALFYPQETTLEMGPTTVIPQSHYPALNREGANTSEQQLSLPRVDGGGPPEPLPPPDVEGPEDRRRMSDARTMLGDESVTEKKLVAPAGTLVLCHLDLFHRGSRALIDTAPWRPMFGIRNLVRVSEPVAPTWELDLDDDEEGEVEGAFEYTGASASKQKLWEEMYRYMRGGGGGGNGNRDTAAASPSGSGSGKGKGGKGDVLSMLEIYVPVLAEQIATIQSSTSEAERLGVAYAMASQGAAIDDNDTATAGPAENSVAVEQLVKLMRDKEHEHIRRAASYGLTVAGAAAVSPMLSLLADPAPLGEEAMQELAARGYLGPDMPQHCKVQALHVLGQLGGGQTSAARTAEVVRAIAACMSSAADEIQTFSGACSAVQYSTVRCMHSRMRKDKTR